MRGGLIDIHSTPLSVSLQCLQSFHVYTRPWYALLRYIIQFFLCPPANGNALFRPLHIYCVDGNTARGIYNIYIISHAWSWRSPKTLGLRRRTISRDVCFPSQIGIGMRASGEACCWPCANWQLVVHARPAFTITQRIRERSISGETIDVQHASHLTETYTETGPPHW